MLLRMYKSCPISPLTMLPRTKTHFMSSLVPGFAPHINVLGFRIHAVCEKAAKRLAQARPMPASQGHLQQNQHAHPGHSRPRRSQATREQTHMSLPRRQMQRSQSVIIPGHRVSAPRSSTHATAARSHYSARRNAVYPTPFLTRNRRCIRPHAR